MTYRVRRRGVEQWHGFIYPMMVNLRFEALLQAGRNVKALGLALLFNFVWAPLFGVVLARLFLPDPLLAVGFLLVMVVPAIGSTTDLTPAMLQPGRRPRSRCRPQTPRRATATGPPRPPGEPHRLPLRSGAGDGYRRSAPPPGPGADRTRGGHPVPSSDPRCDVAPHPALLPRLQALGEAPDAAGDLVVGAFERLVGVQPHGVRNGPVHGAC